MLLWNYLESEYVMKFFVYVGYFVEYGGAKSHFVSSP